MLFIELPINVSNKEESRIAEMLDKEVDSEIVPCFINLDNMLYAFPQPNNTTTVCFGEDADINVALEYDVFKLAVKALGNK